MNILIAGASGLIGQELIHSMQGKHRFTVLGRNKAYLAQIFSKDIALLSWEELNDIDAHQFAAVINLCGVNIAALRWNSAVKKEIIDSREQTTQILIQWIIRQNAKPHIYCANAIGIYGAQSEDATEDLTEDTPINFTRYKDFLNEVGARWQLALKEAEDAGLAVTTTRFGVVLKKDKGFLKKLYPSFICGLGSVIGTGQQMLSWVDSADLVHAYEFLLNHPELTGPINVTAPNPIAQKEFAKIYAHLLKRPLLFTTPAFVIRLLFGEMGEFLINKGQKVRPKRLLEAGFEFKYATIEQSLLHQLT